MQNFVLPMAAKYSNEISASCHLSERQHNFGCPLLFVDYDSPEMTCTKTWREFYYFAVPSAINKSIGCFVSLQWSSTRYDDQAGLGLVLRNVDWPDCRKHYSQARKQWKNKWWLQKRIEKAFDNYIAILSWLKTSLCHFRVCTKPSRVMRSAQGA